MNSRWIRVGTRCAACTAEYLDKSVPAGGWKAVRVCSSSRSICVKFAAACRLIRTSSSSGGGGSIARWSVLVHTYTSRVLPPKKSSSSSLWRRRGWFFVIQQQQTDPLDGSFVKRRPVGKHQLDTADTPRHFDNLHRHPPPYSRSHQIRSDQLRRQQQPDKQVTAETYV